MRSPKELSTIVEELDALVDRKLLHEMYQIATSEKHSFWYINLLNERDQMFSRTSNTALPYMCSLSKCDTKEDGRGEEVSSTLCSITAGSLAVTLTLSCDSLALL